MDKEKIKKKVKDFYEEHKLAVGYAAGVLVCVVSYGIGWKLEERKCAKDGMRIMAVNNRIADVIMDANKNNSIGVYTHAVSESTGLMKDELGKLAECMSQVGVPSNIEFTHFVAMGKRK